MKEAIKNILDELNKQDFNKIELKIKEYEESILENKIQFVHKTTPEKYWNASIEFIDKRIKESKAMFIWITGAWGSGKTYSLYALRNNSILHNNYCFEIKTESELNYDIHYRDINAIDNITVEEHKVKYLSNFYFSLIDYCYKNKKRLYISSTKNYCDFISMLDKISIENAGAISSRFSNNIEIIDLGNIDRRKIIP